MQDNLHPDELKKLEQDGLWYDLEESEEDYYGGIDVEVVKKISDRSMVDLGDQLKGLPKESEQVKEKSVIKSDGSDTKQASEQQESLQHTESIVLTPQEQQMHNGLKKHYSRVKRKYIEKIRKGYPHVGILFEQFEDNMRKQKIKVGTRAFVDALENGFAGIKWGVMVLGEGPVGVSQNQLVAGDKRRVTEASTQIAASIGAGNAKNMKADVMTIQKALLDLGLLSESDFDYENRLVRNSPTPFVEQEKISKTIDAIWKFQEEVLFWHTCDGNISGPDSQTLKNMRAEHMDTDYVQKRLAVYPYIIAERNVIKEKEKQKQQEIQQVAEEKAAEQARIKAIADRPATAKEAGDFIGSETNILAIAEGLAEYVQYNPDFVKIVIEQYDRAIQDNLSYALMNLLIDNELANGGNDLLEYMRDTLSRWFVSFSNYDKEIGRLDGIIGDNKLAKIRQEKEETEGHNSAEQSGNGTKGNETIKVEESMFNAELEQAANSKNPLKGIIRALLGFPMHTFLGPTAGAKTTATFQVNIPIPAAVVKVVLGGGFEQERKKSNTNLVLHKLEAKLGVKVEVPGVEGQGDLFTFFEITAESLDAAADLIYYGIYKLGRSAGDVANDWQVAVGSQGKSLSPSGAIYYGLNYLYGGGEIISPEQAEHNVAKLENTLFDRNNANADTPFNAEAQNEVAYGGGIHLSASAELGDTLQAEAGLKYTAKSVINAKNLNATGVYGPQEAGFWDDYELAALGQQQLELAASLGVGDHAFEGKHVFNWAESIEERILRVNKKFETQKVRVWNFTGYEFEVMGKIGNLANSGSVAIKEMFSQLVQQVVAAYEKNKGEAKNEDHKASLPQISAEGAIANMSSEMATGMLTDIALPSANTAMVEVTDQITVACKLAVNKNGEQYKITLVLTLGNEKSIEIDVEVAELKLVDFDVLGRYILLDQ